MKQLADEVEDRTVSISAVCEILGLNRATYYNQSQPLQKSQREIRRERLAFKIEIIHKESKEIYGAPKITHKLRQEGEVVSEKLVSNIMRENGLKAHYIKPRTKTTRECDFSINLTNILNRDFSPKAPNTMWCTDITYIWTKEDGFVYLNSIMDLFSRKIIAWTLSITMEAQVMLECLKTAKKQRHLTKALVIHSDRGSQYVSKLYKDLTSKMKTSYSGKGQPWDNAPIESFHALIKREWIYRFTPHDFHDAKRIVFEYIEGFYNTERIHSYCDYLSPNAFERRLDDLQKTLS